MFEQSGEFYEKVRIQEESKVNSSYYWRFELSSGFIRKLGLKRDTKTILESWRFELSGVQVIE